MNSKLPLGHLLAFCALAAALTLAASPVTSAATAAKPKKLNPPTELWKSYPLGTPTVPAEGRPAPTGGVLGASHSRAASGRTPTNQNQFPTGVLVTVLLAAMLGAAAILVVRRSIPVRVGGSGRRREQPERALEPTVEPRPAEPIERMSASPAVQDIELERAVPGLHERPPTAAAYVHAVPQPEVWQQAHRAAPSVERCDIKLWRGYVKCQLYAAVAGSASAWAVSPSFRLRDEDAPNAGALQALSTLLAELEHSGWAVITTGPTWYGHRLERSPDGDA